MFFEENYPYVETPKPLLGDPIVANMFRSQFKNMFPSLYGWKWMQGIELEPGEGEEEEFINKVWWWINQKYRVGNGRLVESIEKSFANSYVDLGAGYRLHAVVGNPVIQEKRLSDNVLIFEFLYQQCDYRPSPDGVKRLRELIKYVEKMPNNPIREIVFQPIGAEILDRWAPHSKILNYQRKNHTTKDLIKIYKYWLGIEPTPVTQDQYPEGTYYFWRAKYEPLNCLYTKEQCTCPQIYQSLEDQKNIDRRLL